MEMRVEVNPRTERIIREDAVVTQEAAPTLLSTIFKMDIESTRGLRMSVLNRLASALHRRDETPNQKLAQEIVASADRAAVRELVDNLSNRDKDIQSDCIKVLYEIGERKPELISGYCEKFGVLLQSKNNRLVWGGMTALDSIANVNPDGVHKLIPQIIETAGSGSVIARDHAVGILIKLAVVKEYSTKCIALLLEQLRKCPNNQFPMYVEASSSIIDETNKNAFVRVLTGRLGGLEKESQKRRVNKILRTLEA